MLSTAKLTKNEMKVMFFRKIFHKFGSATTKTQKKWVLFSACTNFHYFSASFLQIIEDDGPF